MIKIFCSLVIWTKKSRKKNKTVEVKSHTRNTSFSNCVGDCTPREIAKKSVEVYKKANVKNPAKTGNTAIDFAIGKIPVVKNWNLGFNIGKTLAILKTVYDETCKKKKINALIQRHYFNNGDNLNENILRTIFGAGRFLFCYLLSF